MSQGDESPRGSAAAALATDATGPLGGQQDAHRPVRAGHGARRVRQATRNQGRARTNRLVRRDVPRQKAILEVQPGRQSAVRGIDEWTRIATRRQWATFGRVPPQIE